MHTWQSRFRTRAIRTQSVLCSALIFLLFGGAPFTREATAQAVNIVSVNSMGTYGDDESQLPSISADGRFVAFASNAGNLDVLDTNGLRDIFRHDRLTGATQLASLSTTGEVGVFLSSAPSISADGRRVAFESAAFNLVPMDMNGAIDAYVHDFGNGVTIRVSVDSAGNEVFGNNFNVVISGNGRHVTFDSSSTGLTPFDMNNFQDVFVHDIQTGITSMISGRQANDGQGGNERSGNSSISRSGRYVAFESRASNLILNDRNNQQDIFVRDRDPDGNNVLDEGNAITFRVSVTTSGEASNGLSADAHISLNGQFVTFASAATNLVPDDTNNQVDVFVHDLFTGETTRASVGQNSLTVGSLEVESNNFSGFPVISEDGRYVAFESLGDNLVAGDTNPFGDILVRDRMMGTTYRASRSQQCTPGNQRSRFPSITGSGDLIAFDSFSDNFVPGDANLRGDIFVYDQNFQSAVTVTLVQPDVGSEDGGELVQIHGTNFTNIADTTVTFNGVAATIIEVNPTLMLLQTPSGDGFAQVVVTNSNGCRIFDRRYAFIDPFFSTRFGHINENSGPRTDVLFVNGRAGNKRREVVAGLGEPITVDLSAPPSLTSARYVLYAWFQAPNRTTRSPLPLGLGDMVLPTPLNPGMMPPPAVIWNTLGRNNQLGTPTFPSGNAPTNILTLSNGSSRAATVTFQGLIQDLGSRISQAASVTNAVILEIQ